MVSIPLQPGRFLLSHPVALRQIYLEECARIGVGLCDQLVLSSLIFGRFDLHDMRSTLPTTENPVLGGGRRCTGPVRELYSVTKGVSVLPGRPAAAYREEASFQQLEVRHAIRGHFVYHSDFFFAHQSQHRARGCLLSVSATNPIEYVWSGYVV